MLRAKTAGPVALLLILSGAAVVRLVFFTGYHGYDDVYYIRRAFELSNGHLTPPTSHWAARIGLVGPTALFYRTLGVTPFSTIAFPFLCSLLAVGVAFALGRRLYDQRTGLIAALLLAFLPMDVIFASMLFPTEPAMLFSGVGLGCFILAERERRPALSLASGVSLGLAALAHEAALMILVIYPAYVLVISRPTRVHLVAAVGLGLTLGLDPLSHALIGDPWARLTVLTHTATVTGTAADVAYRGANLSWVMEPLVRPFAERTFGLFAWLLVPVVVWRLWKPREWSERVLALMITTGFLWLEYGSFSATSYVPLARLPRYLAPLELPAVWLLGHELAERSPSTRVITLAAFVGTSLVCLMCDSGSALAPYQELRAVLARTRPAQVIIEPRHHFPPALRREFPSSLCAVGSR